ncbi:hypothetical protein DAPPUDRAFT_117181 [Daphnia pulex]|uniref:Uncharacterized protein n=1 Tax=Daphnia pulex TaxID=6669 RepID=E9HRT1_DAPPU|nr:hypothetical protein DAPPUDRAFT_117181 [Daphnia pulex]|eukprot:EFX65563.1 hypothetical protein DAPPUDRAFT_117181 [Daphnia pulex]
MRAFPQKEEFEVSTARWHGYCRCLSMKNRLLLSLSNLFDVPVGVLDVPEQINGADRLTRVLIYIELLEYVGEYVSLTSQRGIGQVTACLFLLNRRKRILGALDQPFTGGEYHDLKVSVTDLIMSSVDPYHLRSRRAGVEVANMLSHNDATWSSQGREWAGFLNVEIGGVKGKYHR